MRLLALGVDYRSASTAVREALAFDGPRMAEGLDALAREFPGSEFVVLSTCNRVEVYAAGEPDAVPDRDALSDFLARFHGILSEQFAGHLVGYDDDAMIVHLFRVAASLESLVLGEGQILGQVKDALRAAKQRNTAGTILHRVFENAIRVGKKVREETGMDQGKLSIASVAVDVAREVFDTFHDKTILVIGAGKMGDLTLQHLKGLNPGKIFITNRSPERAEAAAARWGGETVPFDRLHKALIDADVVISTTAAEEPIVTLEQYTRVLRARRNRLSLILDIAVPRDFDPSINDLDQVMLYNVDDLKKQAEANRKRRQKGIDPAHVIIDREAAACAAALRHQRYAGSTLRALGDQFEAIARRELDTLFAAHPDFNEGDQKAIERMVFRMVNRFLHQPRASARSAAFDAVSEHPHPLLHALRHLFGLDVASGRERTDDDDDEPAEDVSESRHNRSGSPA